MSTNTNIDLKDANTAILIALAMSLTAMVKVYSKVE